MTRPRNKYKFEYSFTLLEERRCCHCSCYHPGLRGVKLCCICGEARKEKDRIEDSS